MTMPRVVLYTVITGGYDLLAEFSPEPGVEYWLFTDDPTISAQAFWNKTLLPNPAGLSPRRWSRLPKLGPHLFLPAHDISIYMDASIKLNRPICEFARACVRDMPMAAHPHPKRNCLYSEAEKCLAARLDDPEIVRAQVERYRREGFPVNFGLAENGFLVRRNVDDVIRFDEKWASEYLGGSQRDQLSFMYCVWRTGVQLHLIPQHSRHNPYYQVRRHVRPRSGLQSL